MADDHRGHGVIRHDPKDCLTCRWSDRWERLVRRARANFEADAGLWLRLLRRMWRRRNARR